MVAEIEDKHGIYVDTPGHAGVIKVANWGSCEDASTLLHEVLHFLTINNGLLLKEPVVRGLEHALMTFFKENPEVSHALVDGASKPHRSAMEHE